MYKGAPCALAGGVPSYNTAHTLSRASQLCIHPQQQKHCEFEQAIPYLVFSDMWLESADLEWRETGKDRKTSHDGLYNGTQYLPSVSESVDSLLVTW